jgi:intracellular septation protein A
MNEDPVDGARTSEAPPVSVPAVPIASARAILFGSGPRFARDAFGPVLAFYLGWKLVGLVLGIGLASVVSLLAYRHERKRERPGLIARIALFFILAQALIGLASHSAKIYLAQPVLANAAFGLAFLVSALVRRPLAGMFAREMYDFTADVKESPTFTAIFSRISMAWGVYLLLRSAMRLVSLSMSVERFLVVNLLTGLPLTAGMITWSVWYSVRCFRRSQEWGWIFEEGAQEAAAAGGVVPGVVAGVVAGGVAGGGLPQPQPEEGPRPAPEPA